MSETTKQCAHCDREDARRRGDQVGMVKPGCDWGCVCTPESQEEVLRLMEAQR
jgi:hypothetical protein